MADRNREQARSYRSGVGSGSAWLVETLSQVQILELHVIGGAVRKEGDFFLGQRPNLLHRAADVEKTALQRLARRHQAACADDHFVFHHRAVHDGAAHTDQDAIANAAAVEHDFVADGHVVADQQREAIRIERPGMGDVQYAAILHAGTRADADAVHVAANHRQRPDRAVGANFDIAKHDRRIIDKGPFAKRWSVVLERANRHDRLLLWRR